MSVLVNEECSSNEIMSPDLVNHVFDSVQETYASMCSNTPVGVRGKPEEKDEEAVLSIISLVGKNPITMLLYFPRETACKFSEAFAGMELEYDSSDMNDLIGELANIIAGDTKARLDGAGFEVHLSLPTVIKGRSVKVAFRDPTAIEDCTYTSEQGPFMVRLAVSGSSNFNTPMPGR